MLDSTHSPFLLACCPFHTAAVAHYFSTMLSLIIVQKLANSIVYCRCLMNACDMQMLNKC